MSVFLEIIKNPAIVIALVTLIGLISMKSKPSKVISGTIISFVGFSMIKLGSGILANVLVAFSKLFNIAFHLQGIVPSNEAMFAITLKTVGGTASIILLIALVINILLARFTKFKTVYLSLQLALYIAFALACVFNIFHTSEITALIVGGLLLGLYMTVSPSLLGRYTKDAVASDEYTIAHSGSLAYIIGSMLAKKFGDKSHDAEEIQMNDSIMFLKNSTVATTLTMFILFIIDCVLAHGPVVQQILAGQDFITFSLSQAATFAAGLFIVKEGIKMFIGEIVPAFKGFANIFAPGSIPAVDVLVLFDKAPNTALIGFLTSFVTGLVAMIIMSLLGLPVIIPGLMACFITGGAAAILGNSQGGIRGALIGSVTDGLLLAVMPALASFMFATLHASGTTFADPDIILVSGIAWLIFRFI